MGPPPPALYTVGVLVAVPGFWEACGDAARLTPATFYGGAVGCCGGFDYGWRWVSCASRAPVRGWHAMAFAPLLCENCAFTTLCYCHVFWR